VEPDGSVIVAIRPTPYPSAESYVYDTVSTDDPSVLVADKTRPSMS
jgi:hypothetical protein